MKAAESTLRSLNWLNFSVAAMQAGFGPFVSVRLTAGGWNAETIGVVLSAASVASIVAQVPSGAVIDHLGARRPLAALAILASIAALLTLAFAPRFPFVLAAEIAQGGAGVGLTLAIAAITLCVSRQEKLGERLGGNVRFAAIGAALGTVGLGVIGSLLSPRAVFVLAAAFGAPALLALRGIRSRDLVTGHVRSGHHTAAHPRARSRPPMPVRKLLADQHLLALFCCVALFQLANASLLPLAATEFTQIATARADLLTAVAVTAPQLLTAWLSPLIGAAAQHRGRRIMLMLGLLPVPLRAFAFALDHSIVVMLAVQVLDGISAAAIGVLVPLIVADITHRGGRFNLALGMTGLASAFGAALSTTLSGAIAVAAGLPAAFLTLAAAALGAILVVWALLPETLHLPAAQPAAGKRKKLA